MKETQIEIPDEPRRPGDGDAARTHHEHEPSGEASAPYRNMWVPLIVVPAAIVIAIVLVFSLFGAMSGSEATLEQNLDRIVRGGKNERDQALYGLARQTSENQRARDEGRELPWKMEGGFLERVRAAVDEIDDDNHEARLALGVLLATHEDAAGLEILRSTLALDDSTDPDSLLRFLALQNIAMVGGAGEVELVIEYLASDDDGLRNIAAVALGQLGGERARTALVGALGDTVLTCAAAPPCR